MTGYVKDHFALREAACTLGSNRRLTQACEAALPGRHFDERHGTASVYRVWRSHPWVLPLGACVIRPPAPTGHTASRQTEPILHANGAKSGEISRRRRRGRNILVPKRKTDLIFIPRALSGPPSSPINAPNHRGPAPTMAPSGEVAEWLNAPHSKCGIGASLSGVRIPPSPPPARRSGETPIKWAVLEERLRLCVAPSWST